MISNLCQWSPLPIEQDLEIVVQCLSCLMKQALFYENSNEWFKHSKFDEMIENIAWSLRRLTELDYDESGYNGFVYVTTTMNKNGLLRHFVEFMECKGSSVRYACAGVIGNIFARDNIDAINNCLELGILQKFYIILTTYCKDKKLSDELKIERKEICWTLSNITAGPMEHILLVEEHGLIEILCDYLSSAQYNVAKEALWALYDVTGKKNGDMIDRLVNKYGLIESLCLFLKNNRAESEMIKIGIECMENVLESTKDNISSDGNHVYAQKFERSGMMQILKEKSDAIVDKYFRNRNNTDL